MLWSRSMRGRTIAIVMAALSLLCALSIRLDLVPKLRGPAPYPPEWQWRYRPRSLAGALPALPFAAGLAGVLAWSGSAAARRRPRRAATVVIAVAAVAGAGFSLALLAGE